MILGYFSVSNQLVLVNLVEFIFLLAIFVLGSIGSRLMESVTGL